MDTQPSAVKSCIGTVPQEFNFSIFEKVQNIVMNQAGYFGLSHSLAKERTVEYLKKLQLWDKRNSISRTLSGGDEAPTNDSQSNGAQASITHFG